MASVLVLEDEDLIARLLADWLADAGYSVVGPVNTTDKALRVIAEHGIDAALLDINLGGDQRSFELGSMLLAQRIPFAFLTGYSVSLIPPGLRDCPRLEKPFDHDQVLAIVDELLGTAPA